ncbi:hypothetical protein K2173_019259 [Erythroxylum novogranatense]|uniref:Uncharacterized protein n=1 Tax=Erythroxylum novogranatense TaxID=1862640 RepID=A0AAV8STX8_9ROSI|nr:hypothetical protein K2173_019259 [Erythroxylum novogranatense]
MASTSCAKQNQLQTKEVGMKHLQYPTALAGYEDVVASPKLFMSTLEKLHASMETKFMIPIIGGKELDLHRLFIEVTYRGGIEKVIRDKRWKEVTAIFNFPSTATNASFVLRKYYGSLLYHYEQLYFFKVGRLTPASAAPLQSPLMAQVPAQVTVQPSTEYQTATTQQQNTNTIQLSGARSSSSASSPVTGVIDGKFESGYLVTVSIGSEKLKGVLYWAPQNQSCQASQHCNLVANNRGNARATTGIQRRRRRKKSEIKRRDPAHPKPNRSGYNFFFAEQHARLKPLHPGKDREISRMIGELWNKLKESERTVYQEKAMKDKERYRIEMEDYRERLRIGQVISNAIPLQQLLPEDLIMTEADGRTEETRGNSPHSPDNGSTSGEIDSEDDKNIEKDFGTKDYPVLEVNADYGNMVVETSAEASALELSKRAENNG